ncbi:hypothetical protein [Hymenobacter fodinae]|uniref:Uncharacterized protein n=1 Tax=Hymenobacter fodinae TaxID=2510796 RepID=A0A4Z0P0A7_9BACT|nr:hypothetical protein [Hymenobacter fodinae]TGE04575.1 hypothetical protein EU556_20535 [Hymenobacter fodinae]
MKNALENRIEALQDRIIAQRNMERADEIPGWGMDADPENDPTYPMKHSNGADHQRLNYEKAPQQPLDMEILHSIERPGVTRVFGTSTPPSGLSGAIRRYAYKYSEATATHWMSLILADRVNAVEGKLDDLRRGVLPNPWVERGWRAEWKHNRSGFIQNVATTALLLTAGIMLMKRKNRRKQLLSKR